MNLTRFHGVFVPHHALRWGRGRCVLGRSLILPLRPCNRVPAVVLKRDLHAFVFGDLHRYALEGAPNGTQYSRVLKIGSSLCGLANSLPICAAIRLPSSIKQKVDGVDSMNKTNDTLWVAFETLAKTYPHDNGVRMTADLARWLLEERQRLRLPAPPIMEKVVRTVTQEPPVPATESFIRPPATLAVGSHSRSARSRTQKM